MGKWTATWIFLTCCLLTVSASALTADDYVIAGRVALFERTAAGLIQACDVFAAGIEDVECPDCATDRELIFLHAVARTARLFVDGNDAPPTGDFFTLAGAFGIPLDGVTLWDTRTGEADGTPASEATAGSVEERRPAVRDRVLLELEAIVADLDALEDEPDPFVVYLIPEETGLPYDLEIDYGDVLIFKGLLLAYKGWLEAQVALSPYSLHDPGDIARDVFRDEDGVSRFLLGLAGADGDAELLARARQDWLEALSVEIAATEYIADEDCPAGTDPQGDEFVYFDPQAQPRLDGYRRMLTTLRDSLAEGGVEAVLAAVAQTYDLRDADGTPVGELTLVFDVSGVEGRTGHLALADGTMLKIDWFGSVDENRIGVGLFSESGDLEGWLEATLDRDLSLLDGATLELWGTRSVTMAGLGGQVVEKELPPAEPQAVSISDFCFRADRWDGFLGEEGTWIGAIEVWIGELML